MAVKQLHPLFVAELTGIDLTAGIDAKTQAEIERTMDRYAVTVLPDQNLDDEKQTAFAALYGPLEVSPPVHSRNGGP
jgi:alpha-ketoglutarate-dependent 2,4-dichlorophenoxyacetate dioxygenase